MKNFFAVTVLLLSSLSNASDVQYWGLVCFVKPDKFTTYVVSANFETQDGAFVPSPPYSPNASFFEMNGSTVMGDEAEFPPIARPSTPQNTPVVSGNVSKDGKLFLSFNVPKVFYVGVSDQPMNLVQDTELARLENGSVIAHVVYQSSMASFDVANQTCSVTHSKY